MSLKTYRSKRDFSRTPEPDAGPTRSASPRPRFIIHKHDASRLHYDLRLELDGVLKSWAVPKGPSLDPDERRLAIHVEDHPLEYGDFEGVIPKHEYGGGTVLLWDRGHWSAHGDPAADYERGKLRFRLGGEKLHGGWTLVRMRADEDDGDNWLLIKARDEEARTLEETDVLEHRPRSVASGRDLDEIAADRDRIWTAEDGGSPVDDGAAPDAPQAADSAPPDAADPAAVEGVRDAPPPSRIQPQLAKRVADAPVGDDWLHEMKLDGYRVLCRIQPDGVRFITRNGHDWTERLNALADPAASLPTREAIIDGEVVVMGSSGISDFQALQNTIGKNEGRQLTFYAFDLLYLDGYDTTGAALEDRKRLLRALIEPDESDRARIRYSDHLVGRGPEFYRQACERGLEGIVSKRRRQKYHQGRSRAWLKVKCTHRRDFVIAGYTDPSGSRTGFGALLLGMHATEGELTYAGRVGTGFTEQSLSDLSTRLEALRRETPAFSDSGAAPAGRGIHWVEPELVAEVEFTERTSDGVLRHPSFKGLREDVSADDVARGNGSGSAPSSPPRTRDSRGTAVARVAGVRLTNPERVLYPRQGLTKRDLAEYYDSVADWMLPHISGRPLTLVRCPQGHDEECFFQKHVNDAVPDEICRVEIEESKGVRTYLYVDSRPGLIALVQMGVLELHTWGARADELERPNRLTFDLDPGPSVEWRRVVAAARLLRRRLADLGLECFVTTTGGKGLHLVAPLEPSAGWDEVKAFAKEFAKEMARAAPGDFTANMSKKKRKGKIFIDYLRNARGATAICAYSTRARAGAPVAVPVGWDELDAELKPDAFTVDNLPKRLASLETDPWAEYLETGQSITAEMQSKLEAGAT